MLVWLGFRPRVQGWPSRTLADYPPARGHRVRVVNPMGEPEPLNQSGTAQYSRDDLTMHHHLRVAVALAPAAERLHVGGIRPRIGLKELDKLDRREFVAFDPAEHIVDSRAEEGDNGVDSIRPVERRFLWLVAGAHEIAELQNDAIGAPKQSVGVGVDSSVTIDLEELEASRDAATLEPIEEITRWLSIPRYQSVPSRLAGVGE